MRDVRRTATPVDVRLAVYDKCKYDRTSKMLTVAEYKDVEFWVVVSGADAEMIAAETDADGQDDYNEYLELHLANGDVSTFRNSYVDMFAV